MNARYIDHLSRLERYLPVPQRKLQMLEILSKFRLDCVKTVNIFRVHPSISHNLNTKRKLDEQAQQEQIAIKQNASETVNNPNWDETETKITSTETSYAHDNIQAIDSRHIPTNKCQKVSWKPEESMILTSFIGVTNKSLKQLCTKISKTMS